MAEEKTTHSGGGEAPPLVDSAIEGLLTKGPGGPGLHDFRPWEPMPSTDRWGGSDGSQTDPQ